MIEDHPLLLCMRDTGTLLFQILLFIFNEVAAPVQSPVVLSISSCCD